MSDSGWQAPGQGREPSDPTAPVPEPDQQPSPQPTQPPPAPPLPGYQQPGYAQGYQQPGYQQGGYQQPGYQQPGYQQGYPSWQAFKPGIVPIRPLSLGDILDGAIKLLRFNPASTIGLALVVQLIALVISLPLLGLFASGVDWSIFSTTNADAVPDTRSVLSLGGGLAAAMLPFGLSGIVLTALLTHVASEAVLGRKPTIGETWRAARSRILPSVGASILTSIVWLVLVLGLGGVALWALISSSNSFETAPSGIAVLVAVLVAIALVVIAVWLYIRWMFLSPVIVLERSPVLQAFRRSWRLVSGSFWRIFGILVVSGLITSVASSVLSFPLQLIGGVAAPLMIDPNNQTMAFVSSMISSLLSQVLATAIVSPFVAAVVCLLYLDQRMRKEGFDITLLQSLGQSQPKR